VDNVFPFLSSLEKVVYIWLSEREIPFNAQVKMFGIRETGSATVDFILPDRNIALRCMGSYWHSGITAEARDRFGKEQLIAKGFIVVDLPEEALSDERIDKTMELAIEGQEVLR